jgi:hypothetical protein
MTPSLLFIIAILAAGPIHQTPVRGVVVGASYLINQNFEGTGYDNSESWTEAGTGLDEDYTTTVLVGSQSLYGISTTSAKTLTSPTFAAQSDCWAYGQFRFGAGATLTANQTLFSVRGNTANLVQVLFRSSSKFRINVGSTASSDSVGTWTTGVTYHYRIHYTKGTGANAFGSFEISTDGTFAGSGNNYVQVTNGNATTDADNVRLTWDSSASNGEEIIWDRILVDDVTIGNNP